MELRVFHEENGRYDIDDVGKGYYDISYAERSEKNRYDLYLPNKEKESYPLLVFLHSGGFFKSDKSRHLSNILNGLLFDYAVASINFRLNDETRYQGSRRDAIDALNHLAAREEIDKNKAILWGESYGSYLALDIVVNHPQELDFSPAGVIDMYCATDLLDFHEHKIRNHQELMVEGKENDYRTFGDNLEEGIGESRFLDHITGNEPPIFIIHGMKDEIIPIRYSYQLEEVLKEKRSRHEVHYIEELGHGIDSYALPQYNKLVFDFIRKQLGE
ncbi:MAG: prolyl oligopeptidase family serine peptidase [Erysipelotrichaceae bacterium]|nr:prolyl oligopeptidase family serine peptidase [Erysipelotrichaceae bacterium]